MLFGQWLFSFISVDFPHPIEFFYLILLGITSALPALTQYPHELFLLGAVCEMIGLSVCYALSSLIERRRLLVIFFFATALATALVPAMRDTEPYSKPFRWPFKTKPFFSFSQYFHGFIW